MRRSTATTMGTRHLLCVVALLVCLALCRPVLAFVPSPPSPALQSLFASAGAFFNFSTANPYHQAQWSAPPSGQPNCGIIVFDAPAQEMDLSDSQNYFPYQSRLPTPEWYLPIPSSCNPSVSACPLMAGYGLVSPGWSLAAWVSIQGFEGGAHLFSALQGGFTLRFSVNPTTRFLELSASNYAFAEPIVCTGTKPIPLYAWTMVSVTQWNKTTVGAPTSDAQTHFFVNGELDSVCTLVPYWDTPTLPKANVYIGYDAVQDQDIFHARLAMWAFWYRPLTTAEHVIVAAEEPLSIAGPQNMAVFPAHEAGTPLLGDNPKTISVVPMSAIRGDSSFTLCLNSVPAGGASPNCFTWFSGRLLQAANFSVSNPGAGAVSFTWSASFSGINLPFGDNAYWLSMFILPPNMNFDRQAPWSQVDSTLSLWKTNIGARPATFPDTWLYNPGAVLNSGIIYMNMFWSQRMCYIDQQARNFADTGVTTLPPAQLHPRGLGFSFNMFFNVTSIQWIDNYYSDIWHTSWRYSDGGSKLVNFSIGLRPNFTLHINVDACHAFVAEQPHLMGYQWHLLSITQSESGWLKVYWNAALAYSAQCGGVMNRFTGTTVTMARLGPDPHGSARFVDSTYWPVRMEVASMQYFNRELVQEEIMLNLRNPPASINTFPFPLKATTLHPYVLPQGQMFSLGVYPSSYFGGVVNLYVRANVAGCFPTMYDGNLDGCGGASCGRLQWNPQAMIGASMIKNMDIFMPIASGCVSFDSWVTGDTQRYAKLQIDAFTICVPDWTYLVAQASMRWHMSTPPASATWLDKSQGSGNGAGVVVFRSSTTDMLRMAYPDGDDGAAGAAADGAIGSTTSMQKVGTTGYTIMINLQLLKYDCDQFIWYNDYFAIYLYCSGYLLFRHYNGGWNDYGYCVAYWIDATPGIQVRLGEYMWIAASFNPATNNIHVRGYRGHGGGDNYQHVETHCHTTPQWDRMNSRIGFGYGTTIYTPDVHLSHALWWDKHLTESEFKLVAANLVPLAFVNGRFPLSLSPVPLTCPPSQQVELTMSFPHRYGGLVNVSIVTSPTPGLATPSMLTFDPAVLPWVGYKTFNVSCPPPGTTHVAFVLSGDTTHFFINKDFDLTYADPSAYAVMQLNASRMAPPNAVLNAAQQTVQFNGYNQWVDLNTLAGSGVNPIYGGLTIPQYQPVSLAHSHSLLSCGGAAIPDRGLPSVHLTVANQEDYGYGLSFQQLNSWPWYTSYWWGDQCNAHTPIRNPMPHQWMHWAIVWFSSSVRLYVDGTLLHSFECPTIYRASRPSCYSGRDHFEQRYSHGRLAALNVYDWPLASHEILRVSQRIRPANASFTTALDFPTKLKVGVPVDLVVFSPWRMAAAVSLVITASVAGVLPSNPYTMHWAANDSAVKLVSTQMPVGLATFNLSFATSDNARFTAPPSLTVNSFSTAGLLAEAAKTIPVTSAQHPSQPAFIPHTTVPSVGTVRLTGTQLINFNSAADTGSGALIDPLFITKGTGFTMSGWYKLESMQIDNYLWSAWKSAVPERAYVLRTDGPCLMLRYSDLQSWLSYPWINDNIYHGYGQYKFACGAWQVGVWSHLVWIHDPRQSVQVPSARTVNSSSNNQVWLNGQLVGEVRGGRGEFGSWDNVVVGAPAPADLYRSTWGIESVRYGGICKVAYELAGVQSALQYCDEQLNVWRWANSTSGMLGEYAGGSFWTRALKSWEVQELWQQPPPALGPVKFVSTNPQFLALGWGRSDSFGLAVPLDWNTNPALTPHIYGADDMPLDCVVLSPRVDVPIEMRLYPWSAASPQGMLYFTITAPPFPNTVNAYSTPDLYVRFELTGDTTNFIQPADITLSPGNLLASGTFNLGTHAISQHAQWAAGVTPGTGFHVFPPSASGGASVSLPWLDIGKTRDSLTTASGVWPAVQKSWGGFTILTWLKIELPNPNVPAVIFWTGEIYKPGKSDVQFEVTTPLRRLRLRFFNNSFISRPVIDCRATVDVPLNRWIQVGFTLSEYGNSTLYQSGFPVSSCTFTRGGGGPKGIGEVVRSGTWLGRSANFGGQMFGGFASFTSFDRALSEGEIASLASTPPRNIGVRNISITHNTAFQLTTLPQVSVVTVTPGMETTLGLVLAPLVYSPVWYNTTEMQFFTTVYSDALFTSPTTTNLNFPALAPNAASSKYMTISWSSLLPFVLVDFNSSDVAHYTFTRNLTILNPLPGQIMATALFVLDTRTPSASVGWMHAPSIAVAEGIVLMNNTLSLDSLDLHSMSDTRSPVAPSALIMPNTVGATGFSMLSWLKLTRPTASQLATTHVMRWISWRDSAAANDDGVWAQVDHSTGKITFGAALSTNAQSCSCTSAGQLSYDVWIPTIFVWSATGSMQVYVGDLKATYLASTCTCVDVGFGKYPAAAAVRDSCRLGRLAGPADPASVAAWQLARFAYFDYPLSAVQSKILLYSAQSNISPSGWARTPENVPTNSFLSTQLSYTLWPTSYSSLSGNVTIVPRLGGAGSVSPASITFSDRAPRTFVFTTPSQPTLWDVTFDIYGDTFFFAQPPGFRIMCAAGLLSVVTVPSNMLPNQAVVIAITPMAYIGSDLSMSFQINGVDAITDSNAQVQLSPLSFSWGAQDNTVRYLTITTDAVKGTATQFTFGSSMGGTDGVNFPNLAATNITISNTAHVLFQNVPSSMYANALLLVPIGILPDTVPPAGFTMSLSADLGASVLNGLTSINFPGGSIATTYLTLDTRSITFGGTSTTLTLTFGVSGVDSAIFVNPNPISIVIQKPQPITMLAPASIPTFMYANEQLTFQFLPPETPLFNVSLIVKITRCTFYPVPTGGASPNTTVMLFKAAPLTAKTFTIAAPASPVDTTLQIDWSFGGYDLQHFILPAPVLITVYAQSQIILVNGASIPTRIHVNDTLSLQVTVSKPPLNPADTDNLYLLCDCGTVTPAFFPLTSANYALTQTFNFKAPSGYAEQCRFDVRVVGPNAGYYAQAPTPVFDVLGFFVLISVPPPLLFLGQFCPPLIMETRGISPPPDVQLVGQSTGTGALFNPAVIQFTSASIQGTLSYSAPFFLPGGITAVTVSFAIVGGLDADKLDVPPVINYNVKMLDLAAFQWLARPNSVGQPAFHETPFAINPPDFGATLAKQTISIPYAFSSVEIKAVTVSPNTVFFKQADGLISDENSPLLAGVKAPLPQSGYIIDLSGARTEVTMLVDSQQDGFTYLIQCKRMPPDMTSLQVYPTLPADLRGYLGRIWSISPAALASGSASMSSTLTFNYGADEHFMTMTLPWSTTSLTFLVGTNTDFSSFLSFNPSLVPSPQNSFGHALYDPWTMINDVSNATDSRVSQMANGVEVIFPNLVVGQENLFLLNHTFDGLYVFRIQRLPAPITNLALTFGRTPLQSTFMSGLTAYSYTPAFAPETYDYSVSVPWVISLAYLNASMSFPSLPVLVSPSAQSSTLVANVMSGPLSLPAAATYDFTVTTTQDGAWTWSITREPAHVTSFTPTAYDQYTGTNALDLIPGFTRGRYTYFLDVPHGTQRVGVQWTTDARTSTITVDNAANPLPLTLYTTNWLHLNDTLDGAYTFAIIYSPPDITHVCMAARGRILIDHAGCTVGSTLYAGESSGETVGAFADSWNPVKRAYSLLVPYIMGMANVQIVRSSARTLTMERRPLSAQSFDAVNTLRDFPLQPGLNQMLINSSLDGYYTIDLWRAAPDVSSLLCSPLTNSPGYTLLPAVPLDPLYVAQTFAYSASVPYVVGSVRFTASFSTAGSLRLIVPATGLECPLVSGVASDAVLLPDGATTVVIIQSLQDGNYTVSLTRSIAHVTSFTLTAYDQYTGTNALTLRPAFSRGRYAYSLDVPHGTQRVGVQWTTDARPASVTVDNAGAPLLLTLYTNNLLRLNDTLDGAYAFTLIYSAPNLTAVCMQSRGRTLLSSAGCAQPGASSLYVGELTGATAGQSALAWSAVQHSYTLMVPYIMSSLDARILRTSPHTLTLERSPLAPVAYTAGLIDASFPLSLGSNRFALNSSLDGYYTIDMWRAAPDVLNMQCTPLINGLVGAAASLSPPFTGPILAYAVTVPFATDSVVITASFSTVGSVRLIEQLSGRQSSLLSGVNSSLVVLPVGGAPLLLIVESSQTGNYSLTIDRAAIGAVANPVITFVHPPTQASVGESIMLTSLLVSVDPLTSIASLSYRWRCLSHPSLDLTDVLFTVFLPVNASSLSLRPEAITSPGGYSFELTVTDPDSTHRTAAALAPSARVAATIAVVPAVSLSVTQSAGVDPCAQSPCINGGQCVATPSTSVANSFTLSCRCPTSPIAFHGPICSFAIVSCPNCISSYTGGQVVVLFGVGMHSLRSITVSGRSLAFRSPILRNASFSDDVRFAIDRVRQFNPSVTEVHELALVTPALVERRNATTGAIITGRRLLAADTFLDPSLGLNNSLALLTNPISAYQPVALTAILTGSTAPTQLNYTSLLFYSSSQCISAGTWRDDGAGGCLACPEGGYCPGGGRVWPLAGYWSYSEFMPPIACAFVEACPGVDPRLVVTLAAGTETQICGAGYEGPRCAQCAENYFQLQDRCFFCGSSVDQTRDIAIVILISFIAMCVLALAVAFLRAKRLAYTIQAFVVLQGVAMIGVQGVSHSPFASEQLSIAFTWLNLINMDIEILRPGCGGIPTLTYVRKFSLTLLFMFLSAILFFLACGLRLCLNLRRRRVDPQQVYAEDLIIDEDELEDAAITDGRPTLNRRASVTRQATIRSRVPLLSWKQRLTRFSRSPEWQDASQRLQHSWLILGAIFFLRLNILQLKAFMCAMAPDPLLSFASDAPQTQSLYLIEDMQTRCYEGTHLVTVVFVLLLLLCYSIGFPLFCFVLLMRSFANARTPGLLGWLRSRFSLLHGKKKVSRKKGVKLSVDMGPSNTSGGGGSAGHVDSADSATTKPAALVAFGAASTISADPAEPTAEQLHADRVNRFGFLFAGYRYSHFASCLLVFALQLVVACITVLIPDSHALRKLFAFGLVWTVHTLIIAVQLPFEAWTVNARKLVISLATLAHSTVLLALQTDGSRSVFLFVLLVLFSALVFLLLIRRRIPRWFGCQRRKPRPKLLRTRTAASPAAQAAAAAVGLQLAAMEDDDDEAEEIEAAHNAWITQEEEPAEPVEPAVDPRPLALPDAEPKSNTVMPIRIHAPAGSLSDVGFAELASPSMRLDSPSAVAQPAVVSRDVRLHISPAETMSLIVEDQQEQRQPAVQPLVPQSPEPEQPTAVASDSSAASVAETPEPASAMAALRSSLPEIPSMLATLCKQFELHPPSQCAQLGVHWTAASALPSASELLRVLELSAHEFSSSVGALLAHIETRQHSELDAAAASRTIIQSQMQSLQLEWKLVAAATLTNHSPGNAAPSLAAPVSEAFLAPLFVVAPTASTSFPFVQSIAAPAADSVRACVRALLSLPRASTCLQQLVKEATDLKSMWLQVDRLFQLEQQAAAMVVPTELDCILEQAAAVHSTDLAGDSASTGSSMGPVLQSLRFAARVLVQSRLHAAEAVMDKSEVGRLSMILSGLNDDAAVEPHDSQRAADPALAESRSQLAARLKKGRGVAQCAVIDAALRDPALLAAFLLNEETKQQQVTAAFGELRASDAQQKRVLAARLPMRLPAFAVSSTAASSAPSSFPPLRLPAPRVLRHARSPTGFGSMQMHVVVPATISAQQADQCRADQARLEQMLEDAKRIQPSAVHAHTVVVHTDHSRPIPPAVQAPSPPESSSAHSSPISGAVGFVAGPDSSCASSASPSDEAQALPSPSDPCV